MRFEPDSANHMWSHGVGLNRAEVISSRSLIAWRCLRSTSSSNVSIWPEPGISTFQV